MSECTREKQKKLKELSSNVLNQVQDHKKVKLDNSSDHSVGDGSENKPSASSKVIPSMDFGNASKITINLNFNK